MSVNRAKRLILHVLRIALGVALAAALIGFTLKSTGTNPIEEVAQSDKRWLLSAFAIYGVVICITVRRWGLLLAVQGVHLRFWSLWRLTMIGAFFNLAIPGAVSGDLLKMAFIARQAPEKKAESVLTIMLDRVVGILGLFIIATVMVLVSLRALLALEPQYRAIQLAAFTVGLGSVGGIVAVLLVELRQQLVRLRWLRAVISFGAAKLPHAVVDTVQRLIDALELYRRKRGAILAALAMSIAVHSCIGLGLFCLGQGVGAEGLRVGDYFLAAQVGNAVSAIPVTPGGMGTRDLTIKECLEAQGGFPGEKVGSVPLIYSLVMVSWALVGAMVFIFGPKAGRQAEIVNVAGDGGGSRVAGPSDGGAERQPPAVGG